MTSTQTGASRADCLQVQSRIGVLSGGKVTRLVSCVDPEHALADLGLAPETGASGS
jgi:hypothetical protein